MKVGDIVKFRSSDQRVPERDAVVTDITPDYIEVEITLNGDSGATATPKFQAEPENGKHYQLNSHRYWIDA